MDRQTRVFLGANEGEADFPALERLYAISRGEGFRGFANTLELAAAVSGDHTGEEVTIRGGFAGRCVATTVNHYLARGASQVEVDLPNCRIDEEDTDNSRGGFARRKMVVVDNIAMRFRKDPRLKFKR